MPLKEFSERPTCEKCGSTTVSRVYHEAKFYYSLYDCALSYGIHGEHHDLRCQVCKYTWAEKVVSVIEKPSTASTLTISFWVWNQGKWQRIVQTGKAEIAYGFNLRFGADDFIETQLQSTAGKNVFAHAEALEGLDQVIGPDGTTLWKRGQHVEHVR